MQTVLAGVAAGASLLGIVYAWFARRMTGKPSGWTLLLRAGWGSAPAIGAIAALAAFLLTLPTKPPWSHGLLLGWGILIGALIALFAVGEAAVDASGEAWAGRCAALLSLAALGPSLILLLFRGDPTDALIGCAVGGTAVALCCVSMLAPERVSDAGEAPGAFCRGLEAYIISSSAVVAGSWLAIQRYPRATPFASAGGYWAVPGLLTAVCALVIVIIATGRGARLSPSRLLATGATLAFVSALAAGVLRWRLLPELPWTPCLFAAVGFSLIGWVFLREDHPVAHGGSRPTLPALAAALAALLVGALAYQAGGAYGQTLAAVSAGAVVMLTYGARCGSRGALAGALTSGCATLILLMAWFHLYANSVPLWRSLDFQQHYQFLAVALGAGAVFAILNGATPAGSRAGRLWRTIGLGAAAVATPLLIAALWGDRAVAAYLGGLVVSEVVWLLLAAWSVGDERDAVLASAPHIYLLGSAFIAARVPTLVITFEMTRSQKVGLIAVLAVLVLVAYLAGKLRGMRDEAPV